MIDVLLSMDQQINRSADQQINRKGEKRSTFELTNINESMAQLCECIDLEFAFFCFDFILH